MLNFRLTIAAHLKHSAIGCRYANVYHHNRAKFIKDILPSKTLGTAAKFMPQGNHKTVCHDGHKYMCLNPVFKLMTHWTHSQITFKTLKRRLNLCQQNIALPDYIRICLGKIGSQQIHAIPQKHFPIRIPVEMIAESGRGNGAALRW